MRVKDLVCGKKYKHPLFNFDLTFSDISVKDACWFFRETEENGNEFFRVYSNELDQLTEVGEPIKKECITYNVVCKNQSLDEGRNFYIDLRSISKHADIKSAIIQRKISGDSFVVVKTIAISTEITEEEIQKELENENS